MILFKVWYFYTIHMPLMMLRAEHGKGMLRVEGNRKDLYIDG